MNCLRIFKETQLVRSADISEKQGTIFTSHSHNGWDYSAEQTSPLESVLFVTTCKKILFCFCIKFPKLS